jgi:hypothetical protein
MNRLVTALSAVLVATTLIATPGGAVPARLPPVLVEFGPAIDDQCLITAEGQPISASRTIPPALKNLMLARGVRLRFAVPKPPYQCIAALIFPLQGAGVDVRMDAASQTPPARWEGLLVAGP